MSQHLVIASAWPPERPPNRLIESLVADGHRVSVAAEQGATTGLVSGDIELITLPRANDVSVGALRRFVVPALRAAASPRSTQRIHRRLRGGARAWHRILPLVGRRWDAVHLPVEVAALGCLPLVGIVGPMTLHVDRPILGSSTSTEAASLLFPAASEVQCASPVLADDASAAGVDPAKIHVITPTVDTEFFRPAATVDEATTEQPASALRLVCPAVFHWTGGHDYLLVALRQLLDGGLNLHLDLVDAGSDRQRVVYTVHDLALRDTVTLHHPGDRQARLQLLQSADIVILPATEDRIWPEILEAMACGLPVVATDLPAIAAMLTTGVEGLLVTRRDVSALATTIAGLVGDPARRAQMAQAARARAMHRVATGRQSTADSDQQ